MSGCRTATPATCSTVTVFSLSVNRYDGTPPIRRNVVSRQATSVGRVRSQVGITTRNLDHANHAQNNSVARITPGFVGSGTFGPQPQSNCSHRPGSVIHGR